MKSFKSISALFFLATAFMFGACTQDETMDEIIDNTEINSPSTANNTSNSDEEKP